MPWNWFKLQDRVPALPFKQIRPILESELHGKVSADYEFFQLDLPWRVIRLLKRMEIEQIAVTVRHGTLSEETEKISKNFRGLTISIIMMLYVIGFGMYLVSAKFFGFESILVNSFFTCG